MGGSTQGDSRHDRSSTLGCSQPRCRCFEIIDSSMDAREHTPPASRRRFHCRGGCARPRSWISSGGAAMGLSCLGRSITTYFPLTTVAECSVVLPSRSPSGARKQGPRCCSDKRRSSAERVVFVCAMGRGRDVVTRRSRWNGQPAPCRRKLGCLPFTSASSLFRLLAYRL